MNDKDKFAVWIADTILRANGDEFGAGALADIAQQAKATGSLDAGLEEAAANTRRPGDFGVEFIGPLLPVLLIEFGRLLWGAYTKSLADQGGKALATVTIDGVKALVHQTFSQTGGLSAAEAEAELRKAGKKSGLSEAQIEKLLETLKNPKAVRALAAP